MTVRVPPRLYERMAALVGEQPISEWARVQLEFAVVREENRQEPLTAEHVRQVAERNALPDAILGPKSERARPKRSRPAAPSTGVTPRFK